MSFKFTILGCGSSGGVPRIGDHWGACDPLNPKNRRRRCSFLAQRFGDKGVTTALVDTSPDMREQLLGVGVTTLDGVLYTHDHADHVHGIDDLRMPVFNARRRIDVYMTAQTGQAITSRFGYCFEQPEGSGYPAILNGFTIDPFSNFSIEGAGGDLDILPLDQVHGDIQSLGFKFGSLVYSPDISDVPDETADHIAGADIWIVDALRYTHHPSHFSVEDALSWIERLKPKRAILTHLHIDLDYETLCKELPKGVEPAFDGMVIES